MDSRSSVVMNGLSIEMRTESLENYRSVERMITSRFGSRDLRCSLIPYTIEKEFIPSQQTQSKQFLSRDGAPVIVSIARHQPRKGIDVLLRALRTVKTLAYLLLRILSAAVVFLKSIASSVTR